jgi:cyclophilin family peptidyl-prolyl cis-trans isomerase
LYDAGKVVPQTVKNFKNLCTGDTAGGYGYKGSEIFRIISQFSVQGGNINIGKDGAEVVTPASKRGRLGRSSFGDGEPFPPENYRILHSFEGAGVISMMKDITNKNLQDSRFFITTEPYASWADEKYVAFGIITKGQGLLSALRVIPVQPPSNYPLTRVRITDAGCY